MFNLKFLNATGKRLPQDLHFCEDLLFVTQVLLNTKKVAYVPKALYHYCMNQQSAMATLNAKRETELLARKRLLELISPVLPHFTNHLKIGYADSAISMLYMVGTHGQYRPGLKRFLQKEALRYGKTYFFSSGKKAKMKLRAALIIAFPTISVKTWNILKRKLKITWYADIVNKEL
jgi:hypothetical protein